MQKTNRPLSPHLQVYKPQLTSVLSILHRATGMVITLGAIIIAWWLWSVSSGSGSFDFTYGFLNSFFGQGLLFIWSLCTCYHLFNGIRHLVWDMGHGFELNQAYFSGRLVIAGSVAFTLLVWLV